MKLRCPRCEKKLSVPDKYAGKAIRCPACNRGFQVPKPQTAIGGGSEIDLESLAALESQTSQMSEEERDELEGMIAGAEGGSGVMVRVCPHCKAKTKVEDPTIEVLCSHCWKAIPATEGGGMTRKVKKQKVVTATGAGGFYAELAASVAYPIPALSSIATAAGVAFLAAVLPVVVMTAGSSLMQQSGVGTEQGVQKADLSGVQVILLSIFAVEVFFFSAVSIHSFFDVVRATGIGDDQPPKLAWSPSQWGKSFVSYLALVVYLGVATVLVAMLTIDADIMQHVYEGDVTSLLQKGGTPFMVGMALIASLVPMMLIGISLGNVGQALDPRRLAKSIGKTHVHYIFLVLVLGVYGGLFGFAFLTILIDWFIPKIEEMKQGSVQGNLMNVVVPVLAWGGVMACFFYGFYMLARLHGLFVRSFRKGLNFGTM